jgi:hypothetical protein
MQAPGEPRTMTQVLSELDERGFTEQFTASGDRLRAVKSRGRFAAPDVVVREYYRFEGVSDPDDMSIIYAIETADGVRGTLTDAFGVYSDPTVGLFMADVAVARGARRRAA